MVIQEVSSFPEYGIGHEILQRPMDIITLGNAKLEMVVKISSELEMWGQNDVPISMPIYSAGGCATNVACICSRLGGKAAIICRVGDGRYSQPVIDELKRSGVEDAYITRVSNSEGNLLVISTNLQGDWMVMSYKDPALGLQPSDLPAPSVFESAKFLHIDGFALESETQKATVELAIEIAHDAGCLVSIDSAVPIAKANPDYLAELFRKSDIVFANLDEALTLTKTDSRERAVAALQSMNIQLGCLKMGKEGSWIITPEKIGKAKAYPVQVVDTLAAGDSYIAAILLGLSQGKPLAECVKWGSAAGALACLGTGSLSHHFTMQDVHNLINQN